MSECKSYKLVSHPRGAWKDKDNGDLEIIVNPKEHSNLKKGDILEIYHSDDIAKKVLIQIVVFRDDYIQKETISIEQSIATIFQMKPYNPVHIKIVQPKTVTLCLVEVIIKDQYLSRSDFFRFMESMRSKVVYENKKVEFSAGNMRGQIGDMWRLGNRWKCGYIGCDTRFVFRTSTAVMHIFLQMSEEMWEFDFFGDLYFEKAVSGFLTELFSKWNTASPYHCSHDVTIVLFSRVFYEASEIDNLPDNMKKCINTTVHYDAVNGCFYEDFYQVVIQNERYNDEWTRVLMNLKLCFHDYRQRVLNHRRKNCPKRQLVPKSRISSAEKGNFLETLNMTLNLYQKYYIDRNFDRTGKTCVVITPGPGVFEVDRELMNVTKQRMLDLGVAIDIVCMGEQPLHAVPLFKYIKKSNFSFDIGDDYNIPHWMNASFYRSQSELQASRMCNFIPRIKLKFQKVDEYKSTQRLRAKMQARPNNDFLDFDDHDKAVFDLPHRGILPISTQSASRVVDRLNNQFGVAHTGGIVGGACRRPRNRHISDNYFGFDKPNANSNNATSKRQCREVHLSTSDENAIRETRVSFTSMNSCEDGEEDDSYGLQRCVVGSAETPSGHMNNYQPRKALINPFAPNRLNIKTTANRRRWAHVFPTDMNGAILQPHYKADSSCTTATATYLRPKRGCSLAKTLNARSNASDYDHSTNRLHHSLSRQSSSDPMAIPPVLVEINDNIEFTAPVSNSSIINGMNGIDAAGVGTRLSRQTLNNMFQEGEQKWHWLVDPESSPINHVESTANDDFDQFLHTIGVDWKSLTIPALMPITTDYFPDDRETTLFRKNHHDLLPHEINLEQQLNWEEADERQRIYLRKPLSPREVFHEIIYHRLGQGFQLIVDSSSHSGTIVNAQVSTTVNVSFTSSNQPNSMLLTNAKHSRRVRNTPAKRVQQLKQTSEYKLSIGRIFHVVRLKNEDSIEVEIFKPRYPYPKFNMQYWYQMQVPDASSFDECETKFSNEKLDTFNWSSMDHYTCCRGEGDVYGQNNIMALKFWRSRFLLLPCVNPATTKILENIKDGRPLKCDIYEEKSFEELQNLIDGFLRITEQINKIRRPGQSRKAKKLSIIGAAPSVQYNTQGMVRGGHKNNHTSSAVVMASALSNSNPSSPQNLSSCSEKLSRQFTFDSADVIRLREAAGFGGTGNRPSSVINDGSNCSLSNESSHVTPMKGSNIVGDGSGTSLNTIGTPNSSTTLVANTMSSVEESDVLNIKSPLAKVVQAMMSPIEGVAFLTGQLGLPAQCFVSAEAVYWIKLNVAGIETLEFACAYLQSMIDHKLICHASGNENHRFIFGFYLYCIVPENKKVDIYNNLDSSHSFQFEWAEVAIQLPTNVFVPLQTAGSNTICASSGSAKGAMFDFLPTIFNMETTSKDDGFVTSTNANFWWGETKGVNSRYILSGSSLHKQTVLDINDVAETVKKEKVSFTIGCEQRAEWGSTRYHINYSPLCAFEMEVQWNVATGGLLGDMISGWNRKAGISGFHLLPVPCDPFALPLYNSSDSFDQDSCDPLRGPIYVALQLNALSDVNGGWPFSTLTPDCKAHWLDLLRGAILRRFGFVPDHATPLGETSFSFVHCTGSVFVLIPKALTETDAASPGLAIEAKLSELQIRAHAFAERRSSGSCERVGMVWSWNHMLTKRWRNSNTGDENFQDKLLADFRQFCSNKDDRLHTFCIDILSPLLYKLKL